MRRAPVGSLAVSTRLRFALLRNGIKTLGELDGRTLRDFRRVSNCGPVTLAELRGLVAAVSERRIHDVSRPDADQRKAFARADRLFPGRGRQKLRRAARELARAHPAMIDYIAHAPFAVLLALDRDDEQFWTVRVPDVADRPKLRTFIDRVWQQRSKDNSHAPAGAYALRKLVGEGLRENYIETVCDLARYLDPSTLAQIIPTRPHRQEAWLRMLTGYRYNMRNREWSRQYHVRNGEDPGEPDRTDYATGFKIVARFPLEAAVYMTHTIGQHYADYMIAHEVDPRREPVLVLRDIKQWDYKKTHVVDDGVVVDYAPLPNEPTEIQGFVFHPLRTAKALAEEGDRMHHCVGDYWFDVKRRMSFIYSVRKDDGERAGTLELSAIGPLLPLELVQFRAFENHTPSRAARTAAQEFHLRVRRLLITEASPLPDPIATAANRVLQRAQAEARGYQPWGHNHLKAYLAQMLVPGRPLSIGALLDQLRCDPGLFVEVINELIAEGRCVCHGPNTVENPA